ncbi:MAG TPA: ribosome-associated translation inhibitor RaiA [Clostridia bacterium]|nr:ribosome-associated translation inhibitor RaiA [Clostridia bacterium]
MRIEINSKNYRADENLKALITKKLSKFDKYFNAEPVAKVKLSRIGNDQFTMEISLDAERIAVRSVVTSNDMNSNLDIVLRKLERQIVKYRTKLGDKFRKGALDTPTIYDENNDIEMDDGKVVKVKNFDISVISISEAIEQMELLNHAFYVFVNKEDGKTCVLYRRNDGDYGLIETNA